jgi:hypothetical protein
MNGALVVAALGLATARAHTGEPATDALLWDAQGRRVAVTTHGLLFEEDAPADGWTWVCEEVLGDRLATGVAHTGAALWVATSGGLTSTTDGCDWAWSPDLDGALVVSVWADPDGSGRAWAATDAGLWRSDDGGLRFVLDTPAPDGASLRSAAMGDSGIRWALGFSGGLGRAWWWDGDAWVVAADLDPPNGRLEALGVDAADRLLLRLPQADGEDTLARVAPDGAVEALLETRLGITAARAAGDTLHVAVRGLGIAASTDDGQTWTAPRLPAVGCLEARGDLLFGCLADGSGEAWAATRARSPLPEDWSWEAGLSFAEVAGPRCATGALPTCDALWPTVADQLGVDLTEPAAAAAVEATDAGGCGGAAGALILLGVWGPWVQQRRRRTEETSTRRA